MATRYEYEFRLAPSHGFGHRASVVAFFELMPYVNAVYSEEEFNHLRSALSASGLSIRDASRVVFIEPEIVP